MDGFNHHAAEWVAVKKWMENESAGYLRRLTNRNCKPEDAQFYRGIIAAHSSLLEKFTPEAD